MKDHTRLKRLIGIKERVKNVRRAALVRAHREVAVAEHQSAQACVLEEKARLALVENADGSQTLLAQVDMLKRAQTSRAHAQQIVRERTDVQAQARAQVEEVAREITGLSRRADELELERKRRIDRSEQGEADEVASRKVFYS